MRASLYILWNTEECIAGRAMAENNANTPEETGDPPVYNISLPPYLGNQNEIPNAPQQTSELPLPSEPPPPYEANYTHPTFTAAAIQPPPSYAEVVNLSPRIKFPNTVSPNTTSGESSSADVNSSPPRYNDIPILSSHAIRAPDIHAVDIPDPPSPRIVNILIVYQFVLGFGISLVGALGFRHHYYGSEYGIGVITGILALFGISWTYLRRKPCWLPNLSRRQLYASFIIINGLTFMAALTFVTVHSLGIYQEYKVSSHYKRSGISDELSNIVIQGFAVAMSFVLMLVIVVKFLKRKLLTGEEIVDESLLELSPLPRDVLKINVFMLTFICFPLFFIGVCSFDIHYFGYQFCAALVCSIATFFILLHFGDPRGPNRNNPDSAEESMNGTKDRKAMVLYMVFNTIVMILAVYYIVLHSFGLAFDISLKTSCIWNGTTVIGCDLPNCLSEFPKNKGELQQRVTMQTFGLLLSSLLIAIHLKKWKKLKDHNLL